jgi:hypothetical protein
MTVITLTSKNIKGKVVSDELKADCSILHRHVLRMAYVVLAGAKVAFLFELAAQLIMHES